MNALSKSCHRSGRLVSVLASPRILCRAAPLSTVARPLSKTLPTLLSRRPHNGTMPRLFWSKAPVAAPTISTNPTLEPASSATNSTLLSPSSTLPITDTQPAESLLSADVNPNVDSLNSLSSGLTTPSTPVTDALNAIVPNGEHIGDLASLGLVHRTPVGAIQWALEQIHVTFGLPWWATIIVLAVGVRIAIAPILIKVQVNASRLAPIQPQLMKYMEELNKAKAEKDQAALQVAALKSQKLLKESGAHPIKGLLGPVVQIPIAFSFFFAIKSMCAVPVESMKTGGLWWFPDLTAADPTYLLPILSTAAMYIMLETSARDNPQTTTSAHTMNVFRVVSVLSLPMIAGFSTGILLYLSTNGLLLMIQSLILRNAAIRAWLGILPRPPTPAPVAPIPSPFSPVISSTSRAAAVAPPAVENLNPTFKETAFAIRQYFRDQQTAAIKAAEEQAQRKKREAIESRDLTRRYQSPTKGQR